MYTVFKIMFSFSTVQTCDKKTKCLFTTRLALQYELIVCQQVFGVDTKIVQERVNFTNAYYGADKPRGSRIVFVNGKIVLFVNSTFFQQQQQFFDRFGNE